jgi:N-glycosylase/DNA lyase
MKNNSIFKKSNILEEIRRIYSTTKDQIELRLNEFKRILKAGSDEDIFAELVFCILTPQSKAKSCWSAVKNLLFSDLLLKGDAIRIANELSMVRFRYKKAKYIIEARKTFSSNGQVSIKPKIEKLVKNKNERDWLVRNVKGIGYKEASHFLRNIGLGEKFAILDRHVLKNLKLLEIIKEIPEFLSKKRYLEIENKMKNFADIIKIPLSHLDLLLWYKETGKIFK